MKLGTNWKETQIVDPSVAASIRHKMPHADDARYRGAWIKAAETRHVTCVGERRGARSHTVPCGWGQGVPVEANNGHGKIHS